jgi:hypothetical protein
VLLEAVIALFRIMENTQVMAEQAQSASGGAPQSSSARPPS